MNEYVIGDVVKFNELVEESLASDVLDTILFDDGCIAMADDSIISFSVLETNDYDLLDTIVKITDIY